MSDGSQQKLLVIVDAPDLLPEAHTQDCERMTQFVPSASVKRGSECSGYVSCLDEVRERFPSVTWCECIDDVVAHGVAYGVENTQAFTGALEYIETLESAYGSVDVHYQWECEDYVFTIDGRVGARLSFDAIRDEEARSSIFAERATRAVKAIRWAEQDWQNRKSHHVS
jgi:hypothetical protein